jgi:hypothetical protein
VAVITLSEVGALAFYGSGLWPLGAFLRVLEPGLLVGLLGVILIACLYPDMLYLLPRKEKSATSALAWWNSSFLP